MYSSLQLVFKYLHYYLKASSRTGHGIHSPFVFDFITNVLIDKRTYYCYNSIEKLRKNLLNNNGHIFIKDSGAGSRINISGDRIVKDIAAHSAKPRKFAQLLFRMVNYYQPANILELGTSLGITSAYLASANNAIQVITMEGAKEIAGLAKKNFQQLKLENIQLIEGNFDDILPLTIDKLPSLGFAFVDGNHRKEPTLRYFDTLIPKTTQHSILVFDDIHWSKEMEEAWENIKTHHAVKLTIDLFFVGIVFFREEQKEKQHFIIRF